MNATTTRPVIFSRPGSWRSLPAGTVVDVTAIIDGRVTARLPETYLTADVDADAIDLRGHLDRPPARYSAAGTEITTAIHARSQS